MKNKLKNIIALALGLMLWGENNFVQNGLAATKEKNSTQQKIQLALLLDTSNSMDGLIDQAKSQLWKIVNQLSEAKCEHEKPSLELALYEYGNDRLNVREGYIRQLISFTKDLDLVSEQLFGLSTNGGSEYCGEVISKSLQNLTWDDSKQSLKMIFIAGNEPFNQGGVSYVESCASALRKDIIVNTIFCGNYHEGIQTLWKKGAELTGGNYMNIDQDQKTVFIASPYDDQILQLNILLNNTYVGYGKQGQSKKMAQEKQDQNAASYGKGNAVERATTKTKHVYETESWDLVAASSTQRVDVQKIKTEELPDEMKKMTPEQRKAYLDSKSKERVEVNRKIIELEKKRKEYLAKEKIKVQAHSPSKANQLDDAMINALKKAAAGKNMKF
jgi:hypothetical protein